MTSEGRYCRGEWEALIGKVILCFGDLERILSVFLREAGVEPSRHLASRVDQALKVSKSLQQSTHVVEFSDCCKRLSTFISFRNMLAHNPLMLEVWEDQDGQLIAGELRVGDDRSEQNIDLPALREVAADIEDLASDMWMNLAKIQGSSQCFFKVRSSGN